MHAPEFNIQAMIDAVIQREGGYVDHPADRGGPTKYGITQKTLTYYFGKNQQAADVYNLSQQTARDIYYANYYIKPDIKSLPDLIKPIVFDMVVNSGKRGIKILQDALICHGYDCGKVDGFIGAKTIAAAKAAVDHMGNDLIRTLIRRRVIFYEGLVKADETQRVFLAGWVKRAESFMPEHVA